MLLLLFAGSEAGAEETPVVAQQQSGAHGRKRREFQRFLDDLAQQEARESAEPDPPVVESEPEPEPEAPELVTVIAPRVRAPEPLPPPRLEALDRLLAQSAEQARAQRLAEEAMRRALEEDDEDVLMLLAA